MANYTGTPTIINQWEEGDRFGKRTRVVKRMSITLAAAGGATNLIPATQLGFAAGFLHKADCVLFTDGGSQKRAVWLFTDGTNLYVGDPTQATDANRAIPADITGTLVLEAFGYPL